MLSQASFLDAHDDLATTAVDVIVVGGGFYGVRLALLMRAEGARVLLVEREDVLLGRASLVNQARVHNGYHYPRSILTSLRSRINYTRFLTEYGDCAVDDFAHYYAIARPMSKISAAQFVEFCRRIDAPCLPASRAVTSLFDPVRVESVFEVRECAFDASRLRARLEGELTAAGVTIAVGTEAVRLRSVLGDDGRHLGEVVLAAPGGDYRVVAPLVLNATYSRINRLLSSAGATAMAVKHELTEMALVVPPSPFANAAVTVMDGPFFSLMPYPSRGLHTLSHVRYTPHRSWTDAGAAVRDGDALLDPPPRSRALHMIRDAERYLPCIRDARHVDSLWEVKTLMPRSESDDSRPILFRRDGAVPALYSVLGAKIDSVYDVEDSLRAVLASGTTSFAPRSAAVT